MTLSYKEVADIVKIVDSSDCEELILELEGIRLVIRRGHATNAPRASTDNVASALPVPQVAASTPAPTQATNPVVESSSIDGITICSPMVGTFYRSPSAGDAPFVVVGKRVSIGDPLCLIEVMKLYTTIEATTDGTVEAILADDTKLVEFDQPLFIIRAD